MNITRLGILARRLDEIEATPKAERKRVFNMSVWYCGTAACAAGEACLIPAFQRAGLRLSLFMPIMPNGTGTPRYKDDLLGVHAVAGFFGLSVDRAEKIFKPYSYEHESVITPGMVSTRIKSMIAAERRRRAKK